MVFSPAWVRMFGSNYAVKDAYGLIGKKFNNLAAARAFAKRISLQKRGISFSIWSGKGFTVKIGFNYNSGKRRRGR